MGIKLQRGSVINTVAAVKIFLHVQLFFLPEHKHIISERLNAQPVLFCLRKKKKTQNKTKKYINHFLDTAH